MNNKLKSIPINLIITIVILLFLIMFINSAQNTLGRYMSSFGGQLGFSFSSKQSLGLTYGEWDEQEDRQILLINVINAGDVENSEQNGSVRIRMYIPDNDGLSSVLLNIDSREYTAYISQVPEETAVYNLYGNGSICRFYGEDGKEMFFDFPDSIENLKVTLTLIAETKIDTAGIKLMIEPINLKENGGN